MAGVQYASTLFPVPLKASANLSDLASVTAALTALGLGTTAAAELARIGAAAQADLNRVQQNVLYQGLLEAALRGVPQGLVDGVIDPFSTTADVNTSKSSGYTFSSSAGTIGATSGSNTKALLHFEGTNSSTTFTDDVGHTFTVNGAAAISTAQAKVGSASGNFTGSSAAIQAAASADFGIGTGDFTVEGWVYIPSTLGGVFADFRSANNQSAVSFSVSSSGYLSIYDGAANASYTGTKAISTQAWTHIAFTRQSGTMKTWVNGTLDLTQADSANFGSSQPLTIGARPDFSGVFNGYIDEFRFTLGLARYTANFTPQTTAFALTISAMTLQSATLASAVASPSSARVLVQVDGSSAAFTPNTDLLAYFSRDGGTTFTQGTLSAVGTMPDGTTLYDTGYFDVSGQPAGNSTMTYKLTTPTQKAIVLTGVSMQVKP